MLGDAKPRAYGKAVIVGNAGDREHGAAMIHVRLGLAMRRGVGRGLGLIPGVEKVAGPGAAIDLVFGDIDDGWGYDTMDAMEVSVPDAPRSHEIVLIVGFAAGGRPTPGSRAHRKSRSPRSSATCGDSGDDDRRHQMVDALGLCGPRRRARARSFVTTLGAPVLSSPAMFRRAGIAALVINRRRA